MVNGGAKSNNDRSQDSIKSVLVYATTTLITVVLTMTGFWFMQGSKFITRDEAYTLIKNENRLLIQRLDDKIESDRKLENVLLKNTDAINELKLQVSALNKTLEYIDKKPK